MLKHGFPNGPGIVSPLLKLTKPQIAQEAHRLGIRQGDTWSCYNPNITSNGVEPCQICDACILHSFAWSEIKIQNPSLNSVFTKLSFR